MLKLSMANKKCMPLITNYKSDDSSLDDDNDDDDIFNSFVVDGPNDLIDEDDQPLSNFCPLHSSESDSVKIASTTQSVNDSPNSSLRKLVSYENSVLPSISDSEDSASFSSDTDEEFKKLIDNSSSLPLTELLRSKPFAHMYSEKNIKKRKSAEIINIGYSQFFQEIQSAIKFEHPAASFHDICQLVDERWNQLSKIEKKEYKKHSVVSIQSQQITSLSQCRSKLLSLLSEDKQCCNPTCRNPVSYDPRWNGQYCSTKCVGEHCQLTFIDWCKNKRFGGKVNVVCKLPIVVPTIDSNFTSKPNILNDSMFAVQSIPVNCDDETNVISLKSPSRNHSNNNCDTVAGAAITPTTASTTIIYSSNNNNIINDSSDCVSASLKRKPLFESLRSEPFGTNTFLITSSLTTSTSPSSGTTTNITLTS
ncbi:hypothetical protein MN116_008448 [Schistosoma mekongi]|uniref:HMG box domain-containing protein n=1 Tax=Schistosoma mekongi TaxID=38744 RepID=A0AAE2D218_SCHME|nr:hypothetical protein MN116_008448 [Schistosoma mekongi]